MLIALTRDVSPAMDRCELTHLPRVAIDLDLARAQHRAYERCLEELGCRVVQLPASLELPDSVFVEDAAVVVDELAIVTRPGAVSRRGETAAVAEALARHRAVRLIEPPGTLDGGDVLRIGKNVYVGLSERTNQSGLAQLSDAMGPLGYRVTGVEVRGCLHLKSAATAVLKSAVTAVSEDLLLVNRAWVDTSVFERDGFSLLDIDPAEPFAANALDVGGVVVYPEEFPRTRKLMERCGVQVITVAAGELAKAEGAVTCCSVIFRA
jgi:dimethylargininase